MLGYLSAGGWHNFGEPGYNRYDRDQYGAGLELTHKITDWLEFHSNNKLSGYRESSRVIYGGGGLEADDRTLDRYNFPFRETVARFATDNRLDARFATGVLSHKLLVGVDYRKVHNDSAFGFTSVTPIDIFKPVYGTVVNPDASTPFAFSDVRLNRTGAYAQDQIRYGDLYILLGGRYDWTNLDNRLTGAAADQEKFTYRVGANYVFKNGFAPYIGYATSFEPLLGADSITGRNFRPTEGEQIEGGVKYKATGFGPEVQVFATVVGFDIKQSNVVTSRPEASK